MNERELMRQTGNYNIRTTILSMPVNGLWYCYKCNKINPSEKETCIDCKVNCKFIYVGYTNWIKFGMPSSIIISIILFESLLLYLYISEPAKISLDYIGFKIPNNFVVGYGLDYEGYGRNLPAVYTLIN